MKTLAERCAENAKVRSRGIFDLPLRPARIHRDKLYSKQFSVWLAEGHYENLATLAKQRGCSVGDLVRSALALAYFNKG